MKRFSLILLLAISTTAISKAQDLDTIHAGKTQDFEVPSIDNTPGGWNFSILSTNNFPPLFSDETRKIHYWSLPASFYFGFIGGANQADGISINMGQSYEIGCDYLISADTNLSRRIKFSIGLGMAWRNHRMTNRQMFVKHDDGSITLEPYPEGANPKFSRIHTWGFVVPIKFSLRLDALRRTRSNGTVFSIGPELYFTPHASLKTRYSIDGNKEKLKDNNLHFNKVTVGLQAELLVGDIGIYYKYNPFPVLDTDYAPKFCSMTIGLKVALMTIY